MNIVLTALVLSLALLALDLLTAPKYPESKPAATLKRVRRAA
jgi:hypothetical protein